MTSTEGVGRVRRAARPRSLAGPITLALAAGVLAACSFGGGSATPPQGSGGPTAAGGSAGAQAPSTLAAVTSAGALVLLDPANGQATRTLVPSGVVGDALAVSPDGRSVYYELGAGCQHEIWRVSTADGAKTRISTAGNAPALSPDGKRLAYATQYFENGNHASCYPDNDITAGFQVIVLDLATHQTHRYSMAPQVAATGLPAPVDHLSWSPDGGRLAVSMSAVQDNEGWQLAIMNPATDTTYFQDDGSTQVPLPAGTNQDTFYAEGSFLPNGQLFVVRQCCSGYPPSTTNVDMLEIDPATGKQVRQVAVGLTDRDHTSLDASADGRWLLYLSGKDLEVSHDGSKPTILATGFLAAAW
jgi:WD40 repeat protein